MRISAVSSVIKTRSDTAVSSAMKFSVPSVKLSKVVAMVILLSNSLDPKVTGTLISCVKSESEKGI